MSADNHMGRYWAKAEQLRLDMPSRNTRDEMLRAQARIEDWLTAQGMYSREAVREMVDMVVGHQ